MSNAKLLSREGFVKYAEGFCSRNEFVVEVTDKDAANFSDVVYVYIEKRTEQVLYVGETRLMVKQRSKSQMDDINKHIASKFAATSGKNGNVAAAKRWHSALIGREFDVLVKQPKKTRILGELVSTRHSYESAAIARFQPLINKKA